MICTSEKGDMLRVLTNEEIQTIHKTTLEILEQVGVTTDSSYILQLFADGGADVEKKEKRIRFPAKLIEESLKKAPETVKLCGRDPGKDILLEEGKVYFGFGGTPTPYFRDTATGKIKRPTKEDVAKTTKLGNALPNISFMMSIAGSYDVPLQIQYLHDLDALFNNTDKPIIYAAPGLEYAQKVLEMAAKIVGEDQLRDRCPITLYSESVSPLVFPKLNENLIEFARRGIPIVFGPAPMIGATGPGTQIGTFIISNAETLAAVVLSQIVNPGTPMIYSATTNVMDMRTARFAYGAPEAAISHIMTAQMARHYKLPSFAQTGAGTDSMSCDAQAGAEAMLDSLISTLAGINLIQNVGTMAGGSYGSMEMAIIGNEIIGMIRRIAKGVTVDSETLAIDVIKEVGPGGNFLTHPHTLRWFRRELYMPELFNRLSPQDWTKAGEKNAEQLAREKVAPLLKASTIIPLPKHIQEELKRILRIAEKELLAKD